MALLTPHNAEFAIVSFEGPDEYSRAGGLAVRVRDLCEALSGQGFRTHLFFIGDPALPPVEEWGNLVLHRWAQWISAQHPGGVYDGEWGKVHDLTESLPPFLVSGIVRPAKEAGKVTVIMGEDWQTAAAMIRTSQLINGAGLRPDIIPVWTANNLYGFWNIDLVALQNAARVLTVSRYMKHQMVPYGVNALVTENGLGPAALVNVRPATAKALRDAFASDLALFKIGRYTPDKRWNMALDAVAVLKKTGTRARILIRGDKSPYGGEVLAHARRQGLVVENLSGQYGTVKDLTRAIAAAPESDVLNLTSFLPDDVVPVIYAAVDGVLANSGHEPFGLVGLEVMAAGGLAFVGATGEDYAERERNAVVLDTDDPLEIVVHLRSLQRSPEKVTQLKQNGKKTARAYLWSQVLAELFAKLEYAALVRGVEIPA
ncbi:MAG: hypothetical protein NVSMB52_00470 [Chloroflexota bacterium]